MPKVEEISDGEGESEIEEAPEPRRKTVSNGRKSAAASTSSARKKATPESEDEEEGEESDAAVIVKHHPRKSSASNGRQSTKGSSSKSDSKGTKRKLAEAESANSSANLGSRRAATVDVEAEESDQDGPSSSIGKKQKQKEITSGRPRKKRKVVVEVVQSEPSQQQDLQESYEVRKVGKSKMVADEEEGDEQEPDTAVQENEDEERMVEDVLSEGLGTPERDLDVDYNMDYDPGFVDAIDSALDPVDLPSNQEEFEPPPEDIEAQPVAQAEPSYSPQHSGTLKSPIRSMKPHKTPSPPPTRSPSSSPLPAPLKVGPPTKKRSFVLTQTAVRSKGASHPVKNGATTSTSPSVSSKPATVKKPRVAPRANESDSDTDRPPPPLDWRRNRQHREPTEERSVFWNEEVKHRAILSPAARSRLHKFDIEVMGKEPKPRSATNKAQNAKASSSSTTSNPTKDPEPPRRSANLPTRSYNVDIVPETEAENSQSQELQLPITDPTAPSLVPPATPKSTMKSRMKPRTPLSRASSSLARVADMNGGSRPLRPIPRLSPSAFQPLLELDSSLPESIEAATSQERSRRHDIDEHDDDDEAPMSSIEQFESPDKASRGQKKSTIPTGRQDGVANGKNHKGKQKEKESAEDIWDSAVVRRGRELAEGARRRSHSDADFSSPPPTKRTVADIVAASRSRSASNASTSSGGEDEDEEMADASTNVVPPTSGPPALGVSQESQDDSNVAAQPIEDAYVDLTGPTDNDYDMHTGSSPPAPPKDPLFLREEEEESTQDLMIEIQEVQAAQRNMDDLDIDAGWGVPGPSKANETHIDKAEEARGASPETDDDALAVPEVYTIFIISLHKV